MITNVNTETRTFAVFGDIHGRISLMLTLCHLWERQTGRVLDGVLQVGDFGAFPDIRRLDDSTARFARDDPDELGYSEYMQGSAEGARLLGLSRWPVHWIRGNHEDFEYLEHFRVPSPVDPWGRLHFIPDGTSTEVAGLRIGGLGGMAPREKPPRGRGKKARKKHRSRRHLVDPRAFTSRQVESAFAGEGLDILLTHAAPETADTPWGSRDLLRLAARTRPRLFLFGHHHVQLGPVTGPAGCVLIGLDHLEFRRGQLQTGSWGILDIGDQVHFTWGDDYPWNKMVTPDYRFLELREEPCLGGS